MLILIDNDEKGKPIEIKNSIYSIDSENQEVTIIKELPYNEFFYFSDISYQDFFNLIFKLNFKNCCPDYYVSTISEEAPIYQFSLENGLDVEHYFNLMNLSIEKDILTNTTKEEKKLLPPVGLSIIYEQILIFSKDASWFLHADRYIDKTVLCSENPIMVEEFWKSRGVEDGTAPEFVW
jgi:hypothetical protein